jgi:hypothetical protein
MRDLAVDYLGACAGRERSGAGGHIQPVISSTAYG